MTARACASRPSSSASVVAIGPIARKPVRRELLHGHRAQEVADAEARIAPREAVGRQHVVRAAAVVADGLGRPWPEEHRARSARRAAASRAAARSAGSGAPARSGSRSRTPRRDRQRRSRASARARRRRSAPRQRRLSGARPARRRLQPAPALVVSSSDLRVGAVLGLRRAGRPRRTPGWRSRRRSPAPRTARPA